MSLFARWTHSMSGLEALGLAGAHHGINLTDDTLWKHLTDKMVEEGAEKFSVDGLNAYRNLMLGRARDQEFFGLPSNFERAVRTMSTFWLGSNFAIAQMGDLGGLGAKGIGNLFKGVSAANQVRKMVKEGTISEDELKREDAKTLSHEKEETVLGGVLARDFASSRLCASK